MWLLVARVWPWRTLIDGLIEAIVSTAANVFEDAMAAAEPVSTAVKVFEDAMAAAEPVATGALAEAKGVAEAAVVVVVGVA